MSSVEAPKAALGDLLARDDYVRRRLQPKLSDLDYLVLTDLRELVFKMAARVHGRLFDYGCGAAPYRTLFGRVEEYVGADVTPGPGVDRLLSAEGLTAEPSDSYDVLLSTQVLEHVEDPEGYLCECYRILRPGGHLILSTHGMVEEHGCPFDFHRWTSRGLENLAAAAGFNVVESLKFTTEIRGIVQLLNQFIGHLRCEERILWRYPLAALRRTYYWLAMPCLHWLSNRFLSQAIVPASDGASIYVGVCVLAIKPGD
jgi:SAM-dependent methyltransferase